MMISPDLPWKLYVTPSHAWCAPAVPDGQALVAGFNTFAEGHNALVITCQTTREGFYVPREIVGLDLSDDEAMRKAVEKFTERLAEIVMAIGG